MAKRKNLKRDINYVSGELFTEILVAKMLNPHVDHDKADALLTRILDMQDEYIRRVSGLDGKDNKALVKEYFRKLRIDLQTEVDAIVTEICELAKDKDKA